MAQKIRTEADRKATPRVAPVEGARAGSGGGQRVSRERGSHTNSKKNPGKRARSGGS
jgi:hypothetical protein